MFAPSALLQTMLPLSTGGDDVHLMAYLMAVPVRLAAQVLETGDPGSSQRGVSASCVVVVGPGPFRGIGAITKPVGCKLVRPEILD
jgi:hypothetical protein